MIRHEIKEIDQKHQSNFAVIQVQLTQLRWITGVVGVGMLMTLAKLFLFRSTFTMF